MWWARGATVGRSGGRCEPSQPVAQHTRPHGSGCMIDNNTGPDHHDRATEDLSTQTGSLPPNTCCLCEPQCYCCHVSPPGAARSHVPMCVLCTGRGGRPPPAGSYQGHTTARHHLPALRRLLSPQVSWLTVPFEPLVTGPLSPSWTTVSPGSLSASPL